MKFKIIIFFTLCKWPLLFQMCDIGYENIILWYEFKFY